jgi:putative flippase GtrA
VNAAPVEAASNESGALAKKEAMSAARAAISSFVATLTDGAFYEIVVFATMRAGHTSYAAAAVAGAFAGGVMNFTLNRHWAFRTNDHPLLSQGVRYAVGSFLTLLVLEATLWVIVDRLGFDARAAWFPAKFFTWAAFSYPFQRLVVFTGAAR